MHIQLTNSPPPSSQPNSTPTAVAVNLTPGLPSDHTLTLLLTVIFTPARPGAILYPSCWKPGIHSHPITNCGHTVFYPLLLAVTFIPPYPQINTNPEASLTVPDFIISLYDSSCSSPLFWFLSLFFSFYIYTRAFRTALEMKINRKRRKRSKE